MELVRKKVIPLAAIAATALAAAVALAVSPASGSPAAHPRPSAPQRPTLSTHRAVPGRILLVSGRGCVPRNGGRGYEGQAYVSALLFNARTGETRAYAGQRMVEADHGSWSVAIRVPVHTPAGTYKIAADCDRYVTFFDYPVSTLTIRDRSALSVSAPRRVAKGHDATIRVHDVARPSGENIRRHAVRVYARAAGHRHFHLVRVLHTNRRGRATLRVKITKQTTFRARTAGTQAAYAGHSSAHTVHVGH